MSNWLVEKTNLPIGLCFVSTPYLVYWKKRFAKYVVQIAFLFYFSKHRVLLVSIRQSWHPFRNPELLRISSELLIIVFYIFLNELQMTSYNAIPYIKDLLLDDIMRRCLCIYNAVALWSLLVHSQTGTTCDGHLIMLLWLLCILITDWTEHLIDQRIKQNQSEKKQTDFGKSSTVRV